MSPEILLVDDSSDDAELFRLAAREAAIIQKIRWATTGEEAVELLLRSGYRPALIILDIRMPGMDGLEVLRRLRADPAHQGSLVVMLTGSDLDGDMRAARKLGCDLFITKPASLAGCVQVARQVKDLLRNSNGPPP